MTLMLAVYHSYHGPGRHKDTKGKGDVDIMMISLLLNRDCVHAHILRNRVDE